MMRLQQMTNYMYNPAASGTGMMTATATSGYAGNWNIFGGNLLQGMGPSFLRTTTT
jgi:hypothetical protein